MFHHVDVRGNHLPQGTICLTFDDGPGETEGPGPGPRTWEVGRFLRDEGVHATFFVIGHHAERFPDTLAALKGWGHAIGNHTHAHADLVSLAEAGGDVVEEVVRCQRTVAQFEGDHPVFFRAPFGRWRGEAESDASGCRVASLLNASAVSDDLVGPIGWDVTGEDWRCWRLNVPVGAAARYHLRRIEQAGRGIVLLHDSSHDDLASPANWTASLVKILIPELKQRGYQFVSLAECLKTVPGPGSGS
jgi:peptidoglycan/xylan/chitin deacetylase (PgdA/CDA1 family)